jgi:hypothetical protein
MNLRDVPTLTQTQRLEAQAKTRDQVANLLGAKPHWRDYRGGVSTKFPPMLTMAIAILCLVALVAAFIISAMRIQYVGYKIFLLGIPDHHKAEIASYAMVALAEAASIAFTVAFTVIGRTRAAKAVLLGSVIATALFALSGNYEIALRGHETTLFMILESMLPPLLTLSIAFVLERTFLEDLESWQQQRAIWQADMKVWKDATRNAHNHPRWIPLYANELRDAITKAFSRRKATTEFLMSLNDGAWAWLVKRELSADDWYVYAAQNELEAENPAFLSEPSEHELRGQDSQQTRQTPAMDTALRHLEAHPEDAKLSSRDLAKRIGVGKDTAAKAIAMFTQQQDEDTHETQAIDVPVLEQAGV